MWKCPECERAYANRNQWHSCVRLTLEEALEGASGAAVELYLAVEAALESCGEFRVHPQKTRIAFISVMTFAGVRLARRWVDLSFITPGPIDHPRIRSLVCYGPTSFGHDVRVGDPADVDDKLHEWLCIAMRRGDQESLDSNASVEPLTGRPLGLIRVPLSIEVTSGPSGQGIPIPRYVAEIFEACESVRVRRGDAEVGAWFDGVGLPGLVGPTGWLDRLGLVPGDQADVTLSADI